MQEIAGVAEIVIDRDGRDDPGHEIRPKLVIETGSHLRLIEVFEGANRAAAA